jgi:urate oxidase
VSILTQNAYGKSGIRLTKVTRGAERHELVEMTVEVELEGDFAESYATGDNRGLVATDTMKNTVYALARGWPVDPIEGFGLHLAEHFAALPQVSSTTIRLSQELWERIAVDGAPHPTSFVGGGSERRVATVVRTGDESTVRAGLQGLLVLKTTDSAFVGFERDRYTTLPETDDRILATSVTARWSYAAGEHDWNACHAQIRQAMLEIFARHHSDSVQQTLRLMGDAALGARPEVTEITLELPNRHRILVNLSPFGLDNPNQIFVPTEEPFGMISGTLRRGES